MTPLYFLKTHKINVTNLIPTIAIHNALNIGVLSPDNCVCNLNSSNFFINTVGNFPISVSNLIADSAFRQVTWDTDSQALGLLDQAIKSAINKNHVHIMGSHCDQQIHFIKQYFKDQVTTIGVNYNSNIKNHLLKDVTRYYVYLLQHKQTSISTEDQQLLDTLSIDQLIEEYYNRFNSMNYIPDLSVTECDYNIWVDDFTNKEKIHQLMINLDLPFTKQSQLIYNTWREHQQLF